MTNKKLFVLIFILILLFSTACSSSADVQAETSSGLLIKSDMAVSSPSPTPSESTQNSINEYSEPTPTAYWENDLSEYTPIFVDSALIAIVNGDDWISSDDLFAYGRIDEWYNQETGMSKLSFYDNKETFYIYNVDGLVNTVAALDIYEAQGFSDGNVSQYIDWDLYQEIVPDVYRFYIITSNDAVEYPASIDVYKDETTARYTVDLDDDGFDEEIIRQHYLDGLTGISLFHITKGEDMLFGWDNMYEYTEENIIGIDEMGYDVLNGSESGYKALIMDLNQDGICEVITLTYSYGGHNVYYAIYSSVSGEWMQVCDFYSGD